MASTERENNLDALRNDYKFIYCSQFLHLFQKHLGIFPYETIILEEALMQKSIPEFLTSLFISLLKLIQGQNLISSQTIWVYLNKSLPQDGEFPLPTSKDDWDQLLTLEKCFILYQLIEATLSQPYNLRTRISVDSEEIAATWRVEPLGVDSKKATYWLLHETRLYKEMIVKSKNITPKSRHRKKQAVKPAIQNVSTWKLICHTMEDWETFPTSFKVSRNSDEKNLYRILVQDIQPLVLSKLKAKKRKLQQEEAMMFRKRSSRLQKKELEKLEEERLKELEEKQRRDMEEQKQRELEERAELEKQLERERRLQERVLRRQESEMMKQKMDEEREFRRFKREQDAEPSNYILLHPAELPNPCPPTALDNSSLNSSPQFHPEPTILQQKQPLHEISCPIDPPPLCQQPQLKPSPPLQLPLGLSQPSQLVIQQDQLRPSHLQFILPKGDPAFKINNHIPQKNT